MSPTSGPVSYNGAVAARAIGRYQVVRLLGSGGFATVYLARDDRLDADVAIKVMAENWCNDPEISRRFLEEARLLRRCDDDRVVRVHTIEQLEDGRPYFVMEYADAGTLADRMLASLDDGRPFGLREAVALSCELADCLSVVHDCGIVHRDLKPSNVLYRTVRSHERMLLGDFGLARQMLTATGRTILAGTPEYVAPEQADARLAGTVDERADVYAAAVILHELLTGAVPFGYSSLDQAAAPAQRPPDLTAARPDVPPGLATVVARGMAPDRDDRFPTGRAWLAALQEVLTTLPEDPVAPASAHLPTVPAPVLGVGGAGSVVTPPPGPVATPTPGRVVTPPPGPVVTPPPDPVVTPPPDPVAPVARPVPPGPGPASAPMGAAPPAPLVGGEPPAPSGGSSAVAPAADGAVAPGAADSAPRRRKPLWPLFAGVLAALALVAAVAVVIGRSGGAGSPEPVGPTLPPLAGSTPPTSAPSGTTATTGTGPATTATPRPVVPLTGPGAWFAAASGPTCRPAANAEKLPGVTAAVTCTYQGVVAVFGQTASPAAATAFLARLGKRRSGSATTAWAGGQVVVYGGTGSPTIAWDYSGQPYVGVALSNSRSTLSSWWVSTGRTVRAGA